MIGQEFLCKKNPRVVVVGFLVFVSLFQLPSLMIPCICCIGLLRCCEYPFSFSGFCLSLISLARSSSRSATREIVSERETKDAELNLV